MNTDTLNLYEWVKKNNKTLIYFKRASNDKYIKDKKKKL